jgi:hypothetical protein
MYALSPTTEEIARAVAKRNRPEPVHVFELPAPPKRELEQEDSCPNCQNRELYFVEERLICCGPGGHSEASGCGLVIVRKGPAAEDVSGDDSPA